MGTSAEVRIDSDIVEYSYYEYENGSPEEMRDVLEDIVEEARNMDGELVRDLKYKVRSSKKLDSDRIGKIVDYVYKIDEDGEIYYKKYGFEWSTYD